MNPLCRATPANRAMASMRVKLTDAKMPQGDCYVRRYVRILKSLLFSRLPDGLRLRSYCNWQIAATQKTNKKTGDDNDGKSSVIAAADRLNGPKEVITIILCIFHYYILRCYYARANGIIFIGLLCE